MSHVSKQRRIGHAIGERRKPISDRLLFEKRMTEIIPRGDWVGELSVLVDIDASVFLEQWNAQ